MNNNALINLLLPLVSLIFIFIIVVFVYYYMQKRKKGFFKGNMVEEISRHYLSNKNFISIIKIDEKLYILGVSDNNISNIDVISDKEKLEALLKEENKQKINFSELLKKENFFRKNNDIKQEYKNKRENNEQSK
jgi:flagellar biogenesis protein FliO